MSASRTDRIVETIQSMRTRIEPMRKGSLTVDFANGSMSVRLTEVFEAPSCTLGRYETRANNRS